MGSQWENSVWLAIRSLAHTLGYRLAAQIRMPTLGPGKDRGGRRNIFRVGTVDMASTNTFFERWVVCLRSCLSGEVFHPAQAFFGRFPLTSYELSKMTWAMACSAV
jgi:hypothetical protein